MVEEEKSGPILEPNATPNKARSEVYVLMDFGEKEPHEPVEGGTKKCGLCKSTFGFLDKKVVCGSCGSVVCLSCGKNEVTLGDKSLTKKNKVCLKCFATKPYQIGRAHV